MTDNPPAGQPAGDAAAANQANRTRIEQEIRARYAAELAGADICDSLSIEARIRAEIERALARAAAAPDALTSPPPPPSRSDRPSSRS